MRDTGDMTLSVKGYELMTDDAKTCVGLRLNLTDETSSLKTITIPIDPDAALQIGALLVAHSDWLLGRPVRNWDAL